MVDVSIDSVLEGSELDSVLKRKLVLVERSIDSVNDSVFDDRSICTGLDDSKIGVLLDISDDLVLDGSKLESTLVGRLIVSVRDGSVLPDEKMDSVFDSIRFVSVLVDKSTDSGLDDCNINSVLVNIS